MTKERMVGSRLSPELIQDLELIEHAEQSDRSTVVRKLLQRATREWKLEHFARRYAEGTMSMARAAQESGVSLWEMMEHLRSKKISCQYDFHEWEQDVATVERVLATSGSDEEYDENGNKRYDETRRRGARDQRQR